MTTDRQKTCKCGDNVADFLNDISILEENLREVNIEKTGTYIPAFKESINSIYRNINKIEDHCGIDASNTKRSSSNIFNKVELIESIHDSKKFNEQKSDILVDLSRIRHSVTQKVKDCAKQHNWKLKNKIRRKINIWQQ